MKHTNISYPKRKFVMILSCLLFVIGAAIPLSMVAASPPAQDFGPLPTATPLWGELDYGVPETPLVFGADIKALDTCEDAAPSYIVPDVHIYPVKVVSPGNWISQSMLTELQLGSYSESVSEAYLDYGRTLHETPNGFNGMSLDTGGAITGDEVVCAEIDGGTAVYWSANFNGTDGWLLESIRWTDYTLNPGWFFWANGNEIQLDPPALSDLTLYYWSPNNGPKVNVELGGDEIDSGLPVPAPVVCEGGAPSFIQVGDAVEVWPSGYTQWADAVAEIQNLQGTMGQWMLEWWVSMRPLASLDDEGEPDLYTPLTDDYLVWGTAGKILYGPVCSTFGAEYLEPDVFSIDGYETVYTWWLVGFELDGQTVEGWYPENAVYSYYNGNEIGITNTYYALHPVAAMKAPPLSRTILNPEAIPPACADLLPPLAAQTVYPLANLNLRERPAGPVVGRAAEGAPLTLQAPSVCQDGYRWRFVGNGWIAESSPTGYLVSLTPPVIPTAVPIPTETPGSSVPQPAGPVDVVPQPTATYPNPQ